MPETVWRALCAVEGLKFGEAPETQPVKPAAEEHIAVIKPHLTPQVAGHDRPPVVVAAVVRVRRA